MGRGGTLQEKSIILSSHKMQSQTKQSNKLLLSLPLRVQVIVLRVIGKGGVPTTRCRTGSASWRPRACWELEGSTERA